MIKGLIDLLLWYLILKYRNIKSLQPKFNLQDTFKVSLPVEKILDYRLGICRDYAKLTATLLLTAYPNKEIFFITIPNHVAAGIKIRNRIYILDQKLPILPIEQWLFYWGIKLKKGKIKADLLEIFHNREKVILKMAKSVNIKIKKAQKVDPHILSMLTNKLIKELRLKQENGSGANVTLPLKYYALYCIEDEITEFSLLRAIKNDLENEFCGNINNIYKIEINQKGKDLMLKAYY